MIADRIIAHRGVSSLAPENTLAAVELAATRGLRWVEVDARLLGDGTPVVFHDRSLERCTDGHGALRELDVTQLRALDAGSWFGARFAGERVPLLSELLTRCRVRGLGVNLELKREADEPASALVTAVATAVSASGIEGPRLLVSSFDRDLLAACRCSADDWTLGLLVGEVPAEVVALAETVAAASVHADWRVLSAERARRIKRAGLDLYCYTANDPAAFEARWAWGVDGVITDRPQDFLR